MQEPFALKYRRPNFFQAIVLAAMLTLLAAAGLQAQQAELKATVSKNPVARNERFTLTYDIIGQNASQFDPPNMGAFTNVQGPSRSNRVEYVNGVMQQSISLEYTVQAPDKAGKYTILPATVKFGSESVQSNAITVTVTNEQSASGVNLNNEIFMRVSASKRDVYIGEQIYVTYKLYTRHEGLYENDITQPKLGGFWVQDVEKEEQRGKLEELNGVRYLVHTLKEAVLVPQRTGTLTLDPMSLETTVRVESESGRRSRGFFSDPFFGRRYENVRHKATSRPLDITVKALPTAGKPAAFNGAVGEFELETDITNEETAVNEAVTLRITVSGTGNLNLLPQPKVDFPKAFEVYDPRLIEDVKVSGGKIGGKRTYEYLLIPRSPGEYKIAPVEFAWFDPASGQYVFKQSPEYRIKVARGSGEGAAAVSPGVRREDVEVLADDIRYIKTSAGSLGGGKPLFGSAFFISVVCSVPASLLFVFLIARRRDSQKSDSVAMRRSGANKIARKRLGVARKALASNADQTVYEEVSKALWGYLSDKLVIDAAQLSQDSARAALQRRSVAPELINALFTAIEKCELARFAPGAAGASAQEVYDKAIELITTLEGELR